MQERHFTIHLQIRKTLQKTVLDNCGQIIIENGHKGEFCVMYFIWLRF